MMFRKIASSLASWSEKKAHEPSGDVEVFIAGRQARCIPLVAPQSISSLRSALFGRVMAPPCRNGGGHRRGDISRD